MASRSWPSSSDGWATTTTPSGRRPSTTCARSPCCVWRRPFHEPTPRKRSLPAQRSSGPRFGGDPRMSTLSTHVLDTSAGRPAEGIPVTLETRSGEAIDSGVTDADGRIPALGGELALGVYVLRFGTGGYLHGGFYPEVVVVFAIADQRHHHVPLLLSPYGYATYRGS